MTLDAHTVPDTQREETVKSELIYQGSVITVRSDKAKLPNGSIRPRDVVEHPGGVVVFAQLDDGRVLFVSQYRYPLKRMLLELPAGKLDPPEDPDEAIKRELLEETGYLARHWETLTYIYPAPGFCDEKLWLYRATGLHKASADEARPADDDENIEVFALTPKEIIEKMRNREIVDGKTLALVPLALNYWQ